MNTRLAPWPRLLVTCGLVLGALVLTPAPVRAHGAEDHTAMQKAGAAAYKRSSATYTVPDVVLIDALERRVRLRELISSKDPLMVNFIFTTCSTICPVMTKVFSEVPAALGPDGQQLRMVSISIDPENDTPLQLRALAKSLHANDRWLFLTGRSEDIKSVLLAFGAYRGNKMNHDPVTLIRPAAGQSWVRIDGFASPDELVREYRKTLQP